MTTEAAKQAAHKAAVDWATTHRVACSTEQLAALILSQRAEERVLCVAEREAEEYGTQIRARGSDPV